MGCGDCGYAIRTAVGRYLTCPVKEAKEDEGFELYFSRGRMNVLKSILQGQIPLSKELAEWVYQCSECKNCTEVCHMTQNENIILPTCNWIDHVKVWEALRKDLVEAGFAPLVRHDSLLEYMNEDKMRNPYGEEKKKKLDWINQFPELKGAGELMFFGGCTMPLRQVTTLKNMMKILTTAGKNIAISRDEWCCGSIALRIGDEKSLSELIKHNVNVFKSKGTKTLFTACAGCYRTWKKDYPEIIGDKLPFEVKHITEILIDLLRNKQIAFKSEFGDKVKVTYHDPCHLGRHMNLYDVPREVIKMIPGIELIEMKRNRKNAWCCGAGGGVKSQFSDLAIKISMERVQEAIDSGAQVLLTSCPFCIGNLNDSLREMNQAAENKIKIMDIIDFVASKI
ncbi:MAG: (Fe-S)-binding protein [Promethearchaeota archaeon]